MFFLYIANFKEIKEYKLLMNLQWFQHISTVTHSPTNAMLRGSPLTYFA